MDRTPLFNRLPQATKDLDISSVLERYLGVWDKAFWEEQQKVTSLLDTRDVQQIPDKFLLLLTELVGYRWKNYKPYSYNRDRASQSITRYSYKGTSLSIQDLVREHGSPTYRIIDMASTVAVWNRQGYYTQNDDYFYDSDFHHPGVFILYVQDSIDLEHFLEDFEYIKPAGTKWYIIPVTVGQLGDGDIAIDNAYLVIDTMTYKTDDESLFLSDTFIDEEKNTQQPGVEPVVLT